VRVVFLANDPWSVPSVRRVASSSHDLALVVTRVPRPAGRGGKLRPTEVAEIARVKGLPLAEVETVKEGPGFDALRAAAPDILAVVAYGEILPGEILALPRVAPVNLHFSLLPTLRGANPVARAILEGYPVTGVTTIRMDQGMDTGPILLRRQDQVRDEDDAGSLGARLADLGADLLVETLDRLGAGDLTEQPQDERRASMAPRFAPEEEWIDWTAGKEEVWRRIRALAPDPGARTGFRGRTLKVLAADPTAGHGEPGTILADDAPVVATGEGAITLRVVVPEGRRRMPAADWARGARPQVGEVLSPPDRAGGQGR
jgi:methionyl-tRNA formyltransferase